MVVKLRVLVVKLEAVGEACKEAVLMDNLSVSGMERLSPAPRASSELWEQPPTGK